MDSAPSDGPTTCSCTILAGAGSVPDFSTFTRSSASSRVKFPLICEFPPVISVFTTGWEYTMLSRTMAICLLMLSRVSLAHTLAASALMDMDTSGLAPLYCTRASVMNFWSLSPRRAASPLREALMATSSYWLLSNGFTDHIGIRSSGKRAFTSGMFSILFTLAVSLKCA